jgi:hypothetical protein
VRGIRKRKSCRSKEWRSGEVEKVEEEEEKRRERWWSGDIGEKGRVGRWTEPALERTG